MTSRTPPAPQPRYCFFPKTHELLAVLHGGCDLVQLARRVCFRSFVARCHGFQIFAIASSAFPALSWTMCQPCWRCPLRVRSQAVSVCPLRTMTGSRSLCCPWSPTTGFTSCGQSAVHQNVMVDAVGPILLPSDLCHKAQILERGKAQLFPQVCYRRRIPWRRSSRPPPHSPAETPGRRSDGPPDHPPPKLLLAS